MECLVDMFLKFSDLWLFLNIMVIEVKNNDNGVYVIFVIGDLFFVKFVFVIFSIGVLKSGFVFFKL